MSHYTPEEDALVREMIAQGKFPKEIGQMIGRSRHSVTNRMTLLGIRREGTSEELREKLREAGRRGGLANRNYLTDREAKALMTEEQIAALYAGNKYDSIATATQTRWTVPPPQRMSAPSCLVMACG